MSYSEFNQRKQIQTSFLNINKENFRKQLYLNKGNRKSGVVRVVYDPYNKR
jgi:hypothetical protein